MGTSSISAFLRICECIFDYRDHYPICHFTMDFSSKSGAGKEDWARQTHVALFAGPDDWLFQVESEAEELESETSRSFRSTREGQVI